MAPMAWAAGDDLPPPRTPGIPVPAGQIEKALAGLDGLAQAIMGRSGIPGLAVAVVYEGRTVYAKGFGLRQSGESAPVNAETVFPLASVSKPIGATVVAAQVGKGVVGWDTPVARFLPDFALSNPEVSAQVTIGDLYAHRSGLPDHAGDDLEDIGFGREEVLRRLRFLPLEAFRSGYAYTNFGLTAAAEAVARASGQDWAGLSADLIYHPLGMSTASSRYADFAARPNRVTGHVRQNGRFVPGPPRTPDAQSPAGGVSASVLDVARWMAMVLEGGKADGRSVVDAEALLAALTPRSVSGPPATPDSRTDFYGYGFGISVQPSGRVALSHSGAFEAGAATALLMLPSLRLGIISLSNAIPVGAVEALNMGFADLAQYGESRRDWYAAYSAAMSSLMAPFGELARQPPPATPVPPGPLERYAGRYESEYAGSAVVSVTQGHLELKLGPGDWRVTLRHWDGNRFCFPVPLTNAAEGSISVVDFTADGNELRVELLDTAGLGHFRRI
ncbi:beta-lactamase [Acetobacteraceae bacterium AT-5844]|nr:beta-lactamase [Acetobacteraceae bacterium AT-5844]